MKMAAFSGRVTFHREDLGSAFPNSQVVSGTALTVVQVAQPAALLTSAYGLILCAKLTLVTFLITLAAWNRFHLTPAVVGGSTELRGKLVVSIAIEVAIVVVILGLVAAWRFTPPPRALAIASAKPAFVHIHTSAAMADVPFEPGRAGLVLVSIVTLTDDFDRLDAKEGRLTLENKTAEAELPGRNARQRSVWRIQQFPVPMGGQWNVQVEIIINDFERERWNNRSTFEGSSSRGTQMLIARANGERTQGDLKSPADPGQVLFHLPAVDEPGRASRLDIQRPR